MPGKILNISVIYNKLGCSKIEKWIKFGKPKPYSKGDIRIMKDNEKERTRIPIISR